MANKTLFSSTKSKLPRTDSFNEAGGRAYKFTPKHALAKMAATGWPTRRRVRLSGRSSPDRWDRRRCG